MNNRQGYITALSLVIALAILISFGGIYYMIETSVRENVVINLRDQSSAVAEAALQEVINIVRANPDLSDMDLKMIDPHTDKTFHDLTNPDATDPLLAAAFAEAAKAADGNPTPNDSTGFYDVYFYSFPKDLLDYTGKKVVGRYFSKVKRINLDSGIWAGTDVFKKFDGSAVSGDIFHIVTEGWALDKYGREQSHATAHAFVNIANVGEYFIAIKGILKVGAGSQFPDAKIYARNLNFEVPTSAPDTILGEADYFLDYTPGNAPGSDPWPATGIQITKSANNQPIQLPSELIFPALEEQLTFYKASNTLQACNFNGAQLLPPSVLSGGVTTSNGASVSATLHNKDHVYYCDDDIKGVTIGVTEVRGQVIIASKGPVRIMGNITIPDAVVPPPISGKQDPSGYLPYGPHDGPSDGYPDIPEGLPSTANQLVIYAAKGVDIDGNWCGSPGLATLKLQGVLIISPESTIRYDQTGSCVDYPNYSLKFLGAMFLSDQPNLLFFEKQRDYKYLETLKSDPPPVREFYEILKQFVIRRAQPVPS